MAPNIDEQIQNEILSILFKAHRNPKGRYRNVTFSILQRDVRNTIECKQEDVLRELRYLMEKRLIKVKKERYLASSIGNFKRPGGFTEYYSLSGNAIDMLQSPGKYSNMGYMLTNHKLKVLTKDSGFKSGPEYRGDFQPKTGFLPVDAQIAVGDKIQHIDQDGRILQEKVVGRVDLYKENTSIDHIEVKWLDETARQGGTTVNISGSPIMAPVTVGSGNYVISYNVSSDTGKILQMIQESSLDEAQKKELGELVNAELPKLLEEPDVKATQPFLEKIKSLGQTWLVPTITQMVATYFQHQLGINQ